MKFYLTGGAIRDELLGNEVSDRDYIILDADKVELLKMKFEPVGKDFEVYLHPKTKDEYALAVNNDLYEELERRDLTVNSIAQDIDTGEYFDPFNGIEDAKNHIFKHTSIFFADDPIRLLRVARFKCQYPDFTIQEDTLELCRELSNDKKIFDTIVGERFLLELKKALALQAPMLFFELLRDWGTLDLFFNELSNLWEVPQKEKYHPEGNCWIHSMLVLRKSCELSSSFSIRFASLVHDLGKGVTPDEVLPSHIKHEINGVSLVERVCKRFKIDNYTKKLAVAVCKNHLNVHNIFELKAGTILKLLIEFNALREGTLFEDALLCCYADSIGRGEEFQSKIYPQKDFLLKVTAELKSLPLNELTSKYEGKKLGEMIEQLRIKKIKKLKMKRVII
jgi:tRNA nucleotidyltransferase (CCA-adding enzyme)